MSFLIQYIKNSKKQRIGVLYAYKDEKGIHIGWSKCNKLDQFDKQKGTLIAIGRAIEGSNTPMPRAIRQKYLDFVDRADHYFNNPNGRRVEANTTSPSMCSVLSYPKEAPKKVSIVDCIRTSIYSFFGV